MELVNMYVQLNHVPLFVHVKQLWETDGIRATPIMASLIEDAGIPRNLYRNLYFSNEPLTFEGKNDFYKTCLGFILHLIDAQDFENIPVVFEYENMVHEYNEGQDS
jgi:hypothetical protein